MAETLIAERAFLATMRDPDDPDMMKRNAIHTTGGAAQYGFQGALVGGVTLYGWAVPTILDAFGEEWLDRGWVFVRFRRPTYPNTQMTVRIVRGDDAPATFSVVNDQDEVCMHGDIGIGDAPFLGEFHVSPRRDADPTLEVHDALTLEGAPIGTELRTLGYRISVEEAREFGLQQEVQSPLFTGDQPLVHPSVIARHMITLLAHSYEYGRPAIHVSSHIQHIGRVEAGQDLALSGQFIDAYERGGHHYAVIDANLYGEDGRELARIRHTNIFKVAKRER
ncbi:MAG: hypothetical protein GEU80_06235 [Dehalococcoidia bacterium]|nr:hypothetical protein [Dehalococcoidia bacterium]